MKVQGNSRTEEQPEHDMDSEIMLSEDAEISHVISDLIDQSTRSKALQKYITVGEFFYQNHVNSNEKVKQLEQTLRKPYFHLKPLDVKQLRSCHRHLDLVEMEGDLTVVYVKLYERCLISYIHFLDFWMRYMES